MLAYWAAPNLQGLSNNYVVNLTTKPTVTQFIGRVDWNASTKHRIFAKYVWHHWVSPGADPYGFIKNPTIGTNLFNQVVLGDSYSLNPNTVLDFRLAYFRADTISTNENAPFDLSFLGWPSNTIANLKYKLIPRVAVSGYSNQGGGGQTIKPIEEDDSFSASVTKILGRTRRNSNTSIFRMPLPVMPSHPTCSAFSKPATLKMRSFRQQWSITSGLTLATPSRLPTNWR
jgi:hypothetical protein